MNLNLILYEPMKSRLIVSLKANDYFRIKAPSRIFDTSLFTCKFGQTKP